LLRLKGILPVIRTSASGNFVSDAQALTRGLPLRRIACGDSVFLGGLFIGKPSESRRAFCLNEEISVIAVQTLQKRIGILLLFCLCGVILPDNTSGEDALPRRLKAGDSAPEWQELAGTDGKQHSLSDLTEKHVVVVCFTCNTCPYSVDYEDRLKQLQQKYVDSGLNVVVVAINSNDVPADGIEPMKERARDKQFNFAYLRDETQQVARSYGAVFTPEFFVLDQMRRVVYRGAMDDQTSADKVTVRYVELAVTAALSVKLPEVTETAPRGCQVRYRKERRSSGKPRPQ